MEGLFVLLAIVPIALLVLLIINISKMNGLKEEVRLTRLQMQELMKAMAHRPLTPTPPPAREAQVVPPAPAAPEPPREAPAPQPTPAPPPPVAAPPLPPVPVAPPIETAPPIVVIPPARPEPLHGLREELREQQAAAAGKARAVPERVVIAPPQPPPPPAPPKPSFLDRNPDLEKFIGENLINKIGIAILVLGLGFLMNWAIEQGYLSKTARTLIGLASGGLLIAIAHRLRDKFRAFSSVLVGGGLAVLYFTITFAYRVYEIIPQVPAFLVMVGITGLGVLLTLLYDRRELAVIALVGGFAAPFLTSRGEGNYVVLFSYLLILNTGMLVLANYKKWHLINVIAFLLTSIIFGAWLSSRFLYMDPRPVWPAMGFAAAFFLVFFTMNLRYNLRHGSAFVALDFSLLLANTAVFFAAGLSILQRVEPSLDGLFVILLAAFHLVFAWMFHRRANAPKHLVYLFIGLVLTFLSLAGPLQLNGNHITLFWAAECALLLWFSQRTGIRLVERASIVVAALMLISLVMDFSQLYGAEPLVRLRPLLNKAWITGAVSAVALFIYGWLCRKLPADRDVIPGLSPRALQAIAFILCAVVLYTVNFLEIGHQLGYHYDRTVVMMALTGYSLAFLVALHVIDRTAAQGLRLTVLVLMAFALLQYISGFYGGSISALLDLRTGSGGAGYAPFHYAAFAMAVAAIVCITTGARQLIPRPSTGWNAYLWVICAYLVFFASQELDHAMLAVIAPTNYTVGGENWAAGAEMRFALVDSLHSFRKAGYPILWGLGSFALMWYGMRSRQRTVRIIALSLFGITLLKLFIYDISGISEGGKVAAFICLGILLLVVSFMYNKLKVLLKEDGRSDDQNMR